MPRQSRRLSESKTYHVMLRGNERRNIFMGDDDRNRFLDILHHKNKELCFCIYAYCLMDNHVHLLINEGKEEIGRIMKIINTTYACYFNKKHNRVGHLFQDRFKSEAIDSDNRLLAAARYIHNNPVKANIVQEPGLYRWSSYNAYIKISKYPENIVTTETILSIFSQHEDTAVESFIEFSSQETNDTFIEYKELNRGTEIEGEKEAKIYIREYLGSRGQSLDDLREKRNITIRNELIRHIKTNSNLSVRQLAGVLGLDRNIVQRVK